MKELPTELTELIINLINSDTKTIIERMAQNVLADPESCITAMDDPRYRASGIILLAVDDAKTTEQPSSANEFYRLVFYKTKELVTTPDADA